MYAQQFIERCEELDIGFGVYGDGSLNWLSIPEFDSGEWSFYTFNPKDGRIFIDSPESLQWLERCIEITETFPKPGPGIKRIMEIDNLP